MLPHLLPQLRHLILTEGLGLKFLLCFRTPYIKILLREEEDLCP